MDYGPTITTHSSNVRALTKDLAAYPIQAFSAYLSNIEPARNDWNTECISKFAEMVSDEFLYARFDELKVIDAIKFIRFQPIHISHVFFF